MKKIYVALCIVLGIIIIACLAIYVKTNKFGDNIRFKKEYESINGTISESGKVVRSISISKDNPFRYITAKKLVKEIENKKSFIIYFGFAKCPWCRSMLPTLINVAKEQGISKIYYLDILDIRDTLALDENSNIISEKRGTDEYYVLLALFNDVLDDYELTDKDGNKAKPNEKRIYAPNVVKVENGIPVKLTTGLSDKQIGAYDELTDQMNQDMYNKLSELMK